MIALYLNTKPGCKTPVTCQILPTLIPLETFSAPTQSGRFRSYLLSVFPLHVTPEFQSLLIYNGCPLTIECQFLCSLAMTRNTYLSSRYGVAFKPQLCKTPSLDGALQAHYAVSPQARKRHTGPGCYEHRLDTVVTCGCSGRTT